MSNATSQNKLNINHYIRSVSQIIDNRNLVARRKQLKQPPPNYPEVGADWEQPYRQLTAKEMKFILMSADELICSMESSGIDANSLWQLVQPYAYTKPQAWVYARFEELLIALKRLRLLESMPIYSGLYGSHSEADEIVKVDSPAKAKDEPPLLTDAQLEIWHLLDGKCLSAKELGNQVAGAPITPEAIRKRVQAVNRVDKRIISKPGRGYYRPDSPPLDLSIEREPNVTHDEGMAIDYVFVNDTFES